MKVIGPKAYIHLDRLKNNICIIKKEIGNIPLMCVIKADAYGHGAKIIAKAIADEDKNIFRLNMLPLIPIQIPSYYEFFQGNLVYILPLQLLVD